MRILCLPTHGQTGLILLEKIRDFRKLVKTLPSGQSVHFEFLTAPHLAENDMEVKEVHYDDDDDDDETDHADGANNSGIRRHSISDSEAEKYTWWYSKYPDRFIANEHSEWEQGLKESIALVLRELHKRNYDGLLGFSQGAAMAFMVMRHMEMEKDPKRPRFGLLFAPYKSRCHPHEKYYTAKLNTPCLVVSGKTDTIIPPSMTEELLPMFANATYITHLKGHQVPAKSTLKPGYMEFLSTFDTKTDNNLQHK